MEAKGQGYPVSPHPAPQPSYPQQPYASQQVIAGVPQPQGGSNIPIAAQSSMLFVGQQNNSYSLGGYQPQPTALIRQPVSVAFGAPLLQPGVAVPRPTQLIQPAMPVAPPPYPGPPQNPANVRYSVPDAPKNLYGK